MSLPLHNHKHGSHGSTRSRCVYHLRERLFTVSDNNKDENDHAFMKRSSFCVTDSKQSCLFTCNHCILSLLGMKIRCYFKLLFCHCIKCGLYCNIFLSTNNSKLF